MQDYHDTPTMQDILAELKEIKAMLAVLLDRTSSADANDTDSRHDENDTTDNPPRTDAAADTIAEVNENHTDIMPDDEPQAIVSDDTAADDSAAPLPMMRHFSLNDKYRYRRELFGGSDRIMYDTLSVLSAMHSIDEATDYLFNDLGWQDTNPDVADFVDIITNYYQ